MASRTALPLRDHGEAGASKLPPDHSLRARPLLHALKLPTSRPRHPAWFQHHHLVPRPLRLPFAPDTIFCLAHLHRLHQHLLLEKAKDDTPPALAAVGTLLAQGPQHGITSSLLLLPEFASAVLSRPFPNTRCFYLTLISDSSQDWIQPGLAQTRLGNLHLKNMPTPECSSQCVKPIAGFPDGCPVFRST